jgi:cytochrome c
MRLRLWGAVSLLLILMTQSALAQADAENGKEVFKGCRACHQVGDGAKNGTGPSLNGILGRKAGTISGFNYSDVNKQAGEKGMVWTEEKMLEYLKHLGLGREPHGSKGSYHINAIDEWEGRRT